MMFRTFTPPRPPARSPARNLARTVAPGTVRACLQAIGLVALLGVGVLPLAGCGKSGTQLGEGGSVVTGSAGPAGNDKAAPQLATCEQPVAVVALEENPRGYVGIGRAGLPESPLPLVRVLMQQSGCFRIVDRQAGLGATRREQELKEAGVLDKDDATVRKGRGIVAQYSIVPSLTFSEQDAGRQIGGILAQIPVLDKVAGAAEQVKIKEAQVVLLLTDIETTEQLSAATGAARTTDLGLGGLVLGKAGAAGGLGWSNTNEGKVIAAAFLDAHNRLVTQLRQLQARPLPPPVATRSGRP